MGDNLKFATILKQPENIHEDADLDIMNENYHMFGDLMDKMYFTEYPKHPQLFSLLFSTRNLMVSFTKNLEVHGIKDLGMIYFTEYSLEDRKKLLSLRVGCTPVPKTGIWTVYTSDGYNCYINLFPPEEDAT